MKIKILFDKISNKKKLHTGWGVSFLVDERIVFDAGEKGSWLMENMKNLKVNIAKIEAVVISHDHWDHQGGLWELLKKIKGLPVYACPNFSEEFKSKVKKLNGNLKESRNVTQISNNIFTTGEISGEYNGEYMPEQGLVVKTKKGISLITGCAHPGIIKMLNNVKESFSDKDIYAVIGGFHLMDKDKNLIDIIASEFKKAGVKKAAPTHCSGPKAEEIFKSVYKNNFLQIKVGKELNL